TTSLYKSQTQMLHVTQSGRRPGQGLFSGMRTFTEVSRDIVWKDSPLQRLPKLWRSECHSSLEIRYCCRSQQLLAQLIHGGRFMVMREHQQNTKEIPCNPSRTNNSRKRLPVHSRRRGGARGT